MSLSRPVSPTLVREPAAGLRPPAMLGVLAALFGRLHTEQVSYCHWKSNEHLEAALEGQTDLDLLVQRAAAPRFTRILAEMGFKRFVVRPGRGSPGLEDYVGFDAASGRLTHLHVHYQLTVGHKFLKGYRLPWESEVLASRVLDEEHGVYVAAPNMEALLLVVRAAVKLRIRDVLVSALGRSYPRGKVLRELRWLAARIDGEALRGVARPLVGERAAELLPGLASARRPTLAMLRAFRARVTPDLDEYRLYGPVATRARRWGHELSAAWHVLAAYALRGRRTSSRTAPQGGLTVALASADPALSATVAGAITRWLATDASTVAIAGVGTRQERAARRARSRGQIVIRHRIPPDASRGARAELASPDLVVTVAADQPREAILRQVKQVIWDSI